MIKGQAATELLIILSVGLAILLIIFVSIQKTGTFSSSHLEISKSKSVVEDLANAAELVFRQGIGSKTKLYVKFPQNINYMNISGQTILMNIDVSGGRDIYSTLDFTVANGTLASTSGDRLLYLIAGKDFVFITENISQDAQFCGNVNQDGTEDCDGADLNGKNCYKLGYDEGDLTCKNDCIFNQTNCSGPGTVPDSISDLQFDSSDAYSIKWTWTNPTTPDFKESIVFVNNSNVGNTSNPYYTATGLTPLTEYTVIIHTTDYGLNINDTDVINIANSSSNNTTANTTSLVYIDALSIQDCNAEDSEAKGTLSGDCDGSYPAACGGNADYLSCNDENSETHIAKKTGADRFYGGVNITVYNSSINDCYSVDTVLLCYEWWASGAVQDCDISIDAEGGNNYTVVTTTCPGQTANPGVTCANVTASEPWTCNNFFNSTTTKAIAKSEVQQAANGQRTITWDSLYFNVTYTVLT